MAGLYQKTACEESPHKNQIDQWINEGRSNSYISRRLAELGEKISDKSVGKYRTIREEYLQKELQKDPVYQAQIMKANETLVEEVGKFKQVNVMNHIAETIEHCAELIGQSKMDDIKIRSIQDLRYVQMSMIEAMKLYGDMALKAQQMQKVEEDPELLRPHVTVNVKGVLTEMLGSMDNEQRIAMIDQLRNRVGGAINE